MLVVLTMIRFQNRICITSQEKENKILIANEEMGAATVDSQLLKIPRGIIRIIIIRLLG